MTHSPICFNQADLDSDSIVRQHRVVLEAKDGHAIWVNSKVLEDISPLPEEVEGGVIIRDASGKPTGDVHPPLYLIRIQKRVPGVFLDNAQFLVTVSPPTYKDLEKRFQLVVDDYPPKGSVRLAEKEKLPVRLRGCSTALLLMTT